MEAQWNNEKFDMPRLGLGTWQAPKGVVANAVKEAIRAGYRLIDCAAAYGNEKEIGNALHEMIMETKEVTRDDLFIVSKVFNTHHVFGEDVDRPKRALTQTLEDLRLEKLDLWLMHWPISFAEEEIPDGGLRDSKGKPNSKLTIQEEYIETWKCMEKLKNEGLVKHIGVSNFRRDQIENILNNRLPSLLLIKLNCIHIYNSQISFLSLNNTIF